MTNTFVYLGPGCGKGTALRMFEGLFSNNLSAVVTSEALTAAKADGDELAKEIKRQQLVRDTGGLVDDRTAFAALDRHIGRNYTPRSSFLWIDGSPRTIGQARSLLSYENLTVIHIDISPELSLARAIQRTEELLAAGQPPRADDDPTTVIRRCRRFKEFTLPGLNEIRRQRPDALHRVDGTLPLKRKVIQMLRGFPIDEKEFRRKVTCLDNLDHPATKAIRKIESPDTLFNQLLGFGQQFA